MRNICVFIKWITFGTVCLGWCREGVCDKKDKCHGKK